MLKIPTALTETAVQSVNFVIPSPTKGIGFLINELSVRFGQTIANEYTIFQLFQFTLAQLELQLLYACERSASCYPFADYHFRLDSEMITILNGTPENFFVLVAMIECYGSFSVNDSKYVVAPPPTVVSPHTIRIKSYC